jgi:hypothetical protein
MSGTTVSLQPQSSARRQYFGVVFDAYTPQVESQMMRDVMALQRVAQNSKRELVIVCDSDRPDRMLSGIGCRRVPTGLDGGAGEFGGYSASRFVSTSEARQTSRTR